MNGLRSTMIVAGMLGALPGWAASDPVALYTAQYKVEYKGRDTGVSEFAVAHDAASNTFSFRSSTQVKGLLRFVSPRPVVEHSEFVLTQGRIQPLSFRYEDGSRKGEDNYTAQFDWTTGEVAINGEHGLLTLAIEPGVLDRGSMQVAVMSDAAAGRVPGPYVLADEDSLKTYEYTAEDDAEIATPVGTFTAKRIRQVRQGSSRHTILWLVPELQYLPVLIQQFRDGEVHTAFAIQSLQWH